MTKVLPVSWLFLVIYGIGISTTAAQTPDGETPSRERACEDAGLAGSLLGLCRAYWEAKDCDILSSPKNKKACQKIANNFARQSGGVNIRDIFDSSVSAFIGPEGGELTLNGVARVIFPANAFQGNNFVTIKTTSLPEVAADFNEFTVMFRPANRLAYEIHINTGQTPPLSETIRVEIVVPDDFLDAVPINHQIELFAQVVSDGGEEFVDLFELFEAEFDSSTNTIIAELPGAIFSDTRSEMGDFEAIITLAPTPGINRDAAAAASSLSFSMLAAATSQCKATSIECPLTRGCDVTSPFNPARKHPVTGEVRPHYGVDYRAPDGSEIVAASDATVERSYRSSSYGETIILRHSDGGATLYAHLQSRDVAVGATVKKGQRIGASNNTGLSSGPHLHFEYVPNGEIIQSKNRIDPDACVDILAAGSITVRDNGPAADDAFEIFLDGVRLGQTAIGAANTLAVSNLIPGNHTLVITAIIAPDNVGTYEVTLSDGLTFSGGGTQRSGTLPQGGSATFTVVVP